MSYIGSSGGDPGFILWLTGMSGAGKSTIACLLRDRLRRSRQRVEVLDGDAVRADLCRDLGFSKEDRAENIRRIGYVADILARNGVIVIVAAISPFRLGRDEIRNRAGSFIEVHVTCPLSVLVERDAKGLYRRALLGELPEFTGISSPYEVPLSAEVSVDTSNETPEASASHVWSALRRLRFIDFDW